MADIRSLVSQIPMEPGYVPAPPEPDLTVIQRLMGLPQTLRAVGQNLAVGAASLPYGIYQGFGNPAAGEAAMSQFQQEYGYTPTNPAAQRQLQGLGEFLQQLETEYKIPPIMAPVAATPAMGIRGMVPQTERLARDLVSEIQTTPPTGAVQLAPTPGLLEKSDIGFYSQLEAAVQPLQNKGTGQQYLAQIQKSAGVKPEEIQWTGLDEFLKNKQSVTKQEIQDYLQANRVDVQEVRLEASTGQRIPLTNEEQARLDVLREKEQIEGLGGLEAEEYSDLLNKEIAFEEFYDKTRFSDYTLPGGENYREILLTLPQKPVEPIAGGKSPATMLFERDMMEKYGSDWFPATYNRLSPSEIDRYEMLVREDRNAAKTESLLRDKRTTFRSSHFDQPNILAHLRVNDRTVDGKKTLFVEEIQSDWHQAGRKKGYNTPEARAAEQQKLDNIVAERQRLLDEQRRLEELALPYTSQGQDAPAEIVTQWAIVSNNLNDLQTAQNRLGRGFGQQVPDAPFKTSWHELSLKRAIQEAAEKGYDQIAFTTGKTQAERYDLSKQVNSLKVERNTDGNFSLRIKRTDQDRTFEPLKSNITQQELSDYIGKDLAERVVKDAEGSADFDRVYSGLDLQVGGEGMKGFYDNILPKSLDKLGKKFGAKVGKTDMDGVEVWQMDITPQMRESVVTKGQPLFAIPAIGAGLLGAGMMQEEETY